MKKSIVVVAVCASFAAASPTQAAKPVELTPAELSNVQNLRVEAPANVAFSSAIATLQTLGYVDIQSNKEAGTLSGTTESKAKTIYNIFWGFGKKKYTQKASLLIEESGPTASLVRLNLHVYETKARGIFGTSFTDAKLIRFRDPYAEFFTAYQGEVGRRVPAAPPTAATGQ